MAYQQLRQPRRPRLIADAVLLVVSVALLMTALGFALTAAYWAMARTLGGPVAALLTALIALGGGLATLLGPRWLVRQRR
mgnify:FL=1